MDLEEELFGPEPPVFHPVPQVSGLWVARAAVGEEDQARVKRAIREAHPDFLTLPRLNQSMSFGCPLPRYAELALDLLGLSGCNFLQEALNQEDWALIQDGKYFTQTILNGYLPGQGIRPHVDLARFGHLVLGVSLGSACDLEFTPVTSTTLGSTGYDLAGGEEQQVSWTERLEPGDVYLMMGDARWRWMHGIPERMVDIVKGQETTRGTRISITLRRLADLGSDGDMLNVQ